MKENEKAHISASPLMQAGAAIVGENVPSATQCSAPCAQHSTNAARRQGLSALLGCGAGNGITQHELSATLGITEREVRKLVERERMRGVLILSGQTGYFLPDTDETRGIAEIRAFVHAQDARLRSNRAAVCSARRLLRRMQADQITGQQYLFEEAE